MGNRAGSNPAALNFLFFFAFHVFGFLWVSQHLDWGWNFIILSP